MAYRPNSRGLQHRSGSDHSRDYYHPAAPTPAPNQPSQDTAYHHNDVTTAGPRGGWVAPSVPHQHDYQSSHDVKYSYRQPNAPSMMTGSGDHQGIPPSLSTPAVHGQAYNDNQHGWPPQTSSGNTIQHRENHPGTLPQRNTYGRQDDPQPQNNRTPGSAFQGPSWTPPVPSGFINNAPTAAVDPFAYQPEADGRGNYSGGGPHYNANHHPGSFIPPKTAFSQSSVHSVPSLGTSSFTKPVTQVPDSSHRPAGGPPASAGFTGRHPAGLEGRLGASISTANGFSEGWNGLSPDASMNGSGAGGMGNAIAKMVGLFFGGNSMISTAMEGYNGSTGYLDTEPQGELFEGEPPLLEELGIDPDQILKRLKGVLLFQTVDEEYLRDCDMVGPLSVLAVLAATLVMTGRMHVSYMYSLGFGGSLGMYVLLNLMSRMSFIDLYTTISILGYSLLPLDIVGLIRIFADVKASWAGIILCFLMATWATATSSRFFETVLHLQRQRFLVAYPLFLFYAAFILLVIL